MRVAAVSTSFPCLKLLRKLSLDGMEALQTSAIMAGVDH